MDVMSLGEETGKSYSFVNKNRHNRTLITEISLVTDPLVKGTLTRRRVANIQ